MLITSRGVCFEKKKGACGRHIDHGVVGGTLNLPKIDEHSHKSFILVHNMTIYHFNVDLLKASNMHTDISHVWIFINVIFYESVCPWIFINVIFD